MNSEEYLRKIINEAVDETASGFESLADFRNAVEGSSSHNGYNGPRVGFVYHGTDYNAVEGIRKTGTSGSKERFGFTTGLCYGRGVYAFLHENNAKGYYRANAVVRFAVKPGAFDNFVIFGNDLKSLLASRGLLSNPGEPNVQTILRLVPEDVLKIMESRGFDRNRRNSDISQHDLYYYVSGNYSTDGNGNKKAEAIFDRTNIDGWVIHYGSDPAVIVRRMDVLIPSDVKTRKNGDWDSEWQPLARNDDEFDNLNLYSDASTRHVEEYPGTATHQKSSGGFVLIGNSSKGNFINTRTDELFSPVPLQNCVGFSMLPGEKEASFSYKGERFILRTNDNGKHVEVSLLSDGGEYDFHGGRDEFVKMIEWGIKPSDYANILSEYGVVPLNQDANDDVISVGNMGRGNFYFVNEKQFFFPIKLSSCNKSEDGTCTFALGQLKCRFTAGNMQSITVEALNGQNWVPIGNRDKFVDTIRRMTQKRSAVNESFMKGTYKDFIEKEIPNTITLPASRYVDQRYGGFDKYDPNGLSKFGEGIRSGKNIYFYTCSSSKNIESILKNGLSYEFTGTSNDTSTYQGIVAYGSFSLNGGLENLGGQYGNTIFKCVFKDDLSKYLIFDPDVRKALGLNNETLSQQIRRLCAGKTYDGMPLYDYLDKNMKHDWGYSYNPHMRTAGIEGLDELGKFNGDAAAGLFTAARGKKIGMINGADLYDERPIQLLGIHGYIYYGGNHQDCICSRNFNAIIPIAYAIAKPKSGYGAAYAEGIPRDENNKVIWQTNPYMSEEWFDFLNNNVSARFQYGGEYMDTNLMTKQRNGFTLVKGSQGMNLMDVTDHRHLIPVDVPNATPFTKDNFGTYATFNLLNRKWIVYSEGGGKVSISLEGGGDITQNQFLNALAVAMQKGALPKNTKIHADAIINGDSAGSPTTLEKLVAFSDKLNGRTNMNESYLRRIIKEEIG